MKRVLLLLAGLLISSPALAHTGLAGCKAGTYGLITVDDACAVTAITGVGTSFTSAFGFTYQMDDDDISDGVTDNATFTIKDGLGNSVFIMSEFGSLIVSGSGNFGSDLSVSANNPFILYNDLQFPNASTGNVDLWGWCPADNNCNWQVVTESGTADTRNGAITVGTASGNTTVYLGGNASELNLPANAVTINEAGNMTRIGTGSIEATKIQSGATAPASLAVQADGDVYAWTASTAGSCSTGGSALTLCQRISGTWVKLGDGGGGGAAHITEPVACSSANGVLNDLCYQVAGSSAKSLWVCTTATCTGAGWIQASFTDIGGIKHLSVTSPTMCSTQNGVLDDICRQAGTNQQNSLWMCGSASCSGSGWVQISGLAGGVVNQTTNLTLPASGAIVRNYTNAGATGTVTFTLPTCIAGTVYHFYVMASQALRIVPPSGEWLRNSGLSGPASVGQGIQQDGSVLYSRVTVKGLCMSGAEWIVEGTEGGEWLPF